jgi:RNA polymerase sigma factor (sigma-70 family)
METRGGGTSYNPMWTLSDESLLAGLGAGDTQAAAAFVRRFQARVFGLAMSMVGDRHAAEDIAQETFVRAWKHAGAFDPRRGAVATWLLTIARNISVDVIRMRRADPVDPEALLASVGVGGDPDDRLASADDSQRLRNAIRSLPEEQRRALVLAAFLGLTGREISEHEDVPLGTVKTRIRAGMLKLRAALEVTDE